jgi:transcriptional regulator with XRE-family HTH domain
MIDPIYTVLGAAIRQQRESVGMTQDALASKVSISRTSVTNIERGRQSLLVHQLLKFSTALGVPPDALLPPAEPVDPTAEQFDMPDEFQELLARLDGSKAIR